MTMRDAKIDGRRLPKRAAPITSNAVERSITVKLPPALHDAFERLAASHGLTKSGLAGVLIQNAINDAIDAGRK
jgi:hypothetical protein